MNANAREDALLVSGELVRTIAVQKVRFLAYITECDRDPTLLKVAHYVGSVILREVAESLAALGGGRLAERLLSDREHLTPGGVLARLQEVEPVARRAHQKLGGRLPAVEPEASIPTLAEHRARLVALVAVDEAGERIFTADNWPRLLDMPPDVLDRIYTAAAKLNQFPLPPIKEAESPPEADAEAEPPEKPKKKSKPGPKPGRHAKRNAHIVRRIDSGENQADVARDENLERSTINEIYMKAKKNDSQRT